MEEAFSKFSSSGPFFCISFLATNEKKYGDGLPEKPGKTLNFYLVGWTSTYHDYHEIDVH